MSGPRERRARIGERSGSCRPATCSRTCTRGVLPALLPFLTAELGLSLASTGTLVLASQSYITLRLSSLKFITSSLTPSGSSKKMA